MRKACALVGTVVAFGAGASSAAAAQGNSDGFAVRVLSNRADLISDGNALVGVALPRHESLSSVAATLTNDAGSDNVTGIFHELPSGRNQGLLEGLELGKNVLEVELSNGRSRSVVITNHPNGGPVFSGPQVGPWTCQESAEDEKCNQPPEYEFLYKSSNPLSSGLQPYDPESPPSDVATTTTDQGVDAPFIVRIETGYQNRDQYKIAALYQPDMDWTAWDPQPQWNHKLLITHGASCGVTYGSGTAPSVTGDTVGIPGGPSVGNSPEVALGRGFAVMSTALDNAGHNCNIATQAESLVMAKERLIEEFGQLRYTIGTGCSGGSLTQQQVANAYPGIYQGILPQCSYPDALSTGIQFADYHGLLSYFESPEALAAGITPLQWGPILGHLSGVNAVAADEAFFKTATSPGGDCVPADVVYNAETNPGGVRCSILDYMINIFGPRPKRVWSPMEEAAGKGFAGLPLGNEGVQYGLGAMEAGLLLPEQFVSMNEDGGGLDIDIRRTEARTAGDLRAVRNAYRSGAFNEANNMDKVAIIDLRGPDPAIAHDAYRSWELRARLDREHGTHANQVIWFGPTPLIGDVNFTTEALTAMDEWLSAVETDKSSKSLSQKIIADKPGSLHDECEPTGLIVDDNCELVTGPFRYGTPRTVAGDAITTDNSVCRLKPLDRGEYSVTFTDDQWARMEATFPDGVCDFSKPAVGQQGTIPWQTYQERSGSVIYGGKSLGASPAGSGAGWTSKAFGSWRSAKEG
jgi:hypothetical protein